MGLKKLVGNKAPVDWQTDVRASVDSPSIVIKRPARVAFKVMALRLLGVTALMGPEQLEAIRQAAASLSEADDVDWTVADAQKILNAVGTLPVPSHVTVDHLTGDGSLLFKAVQSEAPKARPLKYPTGSSRAEISILPALRKEGISVPAGMVMEVPVKLMEDAGGLVLQAILRRGHLHAATEEQEESGQQKSQ